MWGYLRRRRFFQTFWSEDGMKGEGKETDVLVSHQGYISG